MARDFANDITASFRNRLAEDFMAGRWYELDDYVKMGELQSLRQILWERNGGFERTGRASEWVSSCDGKAALVDWDGIERIGLEGFFMDDK